MGKGLLGLHKNIEKKKELSRHERAEAFMADYRLLVEKHHIDMGVELKYTPDSIRPILKLKDMEQPEMKPWSQAKRENLDLRRNCKKHKLREKENDCGLCGLAKENWGEGDSGATQEYIDKTEAAINEIKKQEEANEKEMMDTGEEEKQPNEDKGKSTK